MQRSTILWLVLSFSLVTLLCVFGGSMIMKRRGSHEVSTEGVESADQSVEEAVADQPSDKAVLVDSMSDAKLTETVTEKKPTESSDVPPVAEDQEGLVPVDETSVAVPTEEEGGALSKVAYAFTLVKDFCVMAFKIIPYVFYACLAAVFYAIHYFVFRAVKTFIDTKIPSFAKGMFDPVASAPKTFLDRYQNKLMSEYNFSLEALIFALAMYAVMICGYYLGHLGTIVSLVLVLIAYLSKWGVSFASKDKELID